PENSNDILGLIFNHHIFTNQFHNLQLSITIQLAIFLNCVDHYNNVISSKDVYQWTGISIDLVINCTNYVMVALFNQH
ncbi:hypothetical protein K503DRAFT_655433, partial [Rhizopogon vinicolor AM-OR11-026]